MNPAGAIATPHPLATDAGRLAFAAGGNAVDAALAAAITTAVVYPHNTAAGGDIVALVRRPDGSIRFVNATGWAPEAVDAADLRTRHGAALPMRGIDTVTVPGAVAGWAAIAELGARLPWEAHFERAVEIARGGFPASHSLAFCLGTVWEALKDDPGIAATFGRDGRPVRRGETVVQPALAESLATLAREGAGAIYGGSIGAALVTGLAALGGRFALADFADFSAEIGDPIVRRHAGLDVFTSPPNTQGFALLRTLNALDGMGPGDDRVRVLARSFRESNAVRELLLGDPRFSGSGADALIAARPGDAAATGASPIPDGDTIGLATADGDGWGVSLIQSVFKLFGAGILEPETGIILQDRGSAFSLEPDSPNVIAPRKRPAHTLMPVLVTEADGALRFVNATMGGISQPQIHAQLLERLIAGETPAAAVAAPRWIVGPKRPGDPDTIAYVEADVPDPVVATLADEGFDVVAVPRLTEMLGHANVIAATGEDFLAGSDPRSDGTAWVGMTGQEGTA